MKFAKVIPAAITLACTVAALWLTITPDFTQAAVVVGSSVVGIIGVITAKRHSFDDLQRMTNQLYANLALCLSYFITVPSSTLNKVGMIIGAVLSVVAVYWVPDDQSKLFKLATREYEGSPIKSVHELSKESREGASGPRGA